MSDISSLFYNIADDLRDYPEAAGVFVIGGNGTGKTYSTLKYLYENKQRFVFVKRNKLDINLLCAGLKSGGKLKDFSADISPFAPLNRDCGYNVQAASISLESGIGGFYDYVDDEPNGKEIGYAVALSAVAKIKGFDMSDCPYLVFDEFIPLQGERVNKMEGDHMLILYRAISRARELKGLPPLKMICLANSMQINAPLLNTLRLVDVIADMKADGTSTLYIPERRILIHLLDDNLQFKEKEKNSAIYAIAAGTRWAQTALNNEFAYDDFSTIRPMSIKGLRPVYNIKYNYVDQMTLYKGRGILYLSSVPGKAPEIDTDTDAGHLKFSQLYFDLKPYMREGRLFAERFSMYAFIRDFKH